MSNPVTLRFIKVHNYLKEEKIVASSRQFAISIDTAPQSLNQVLKGKRDVTVTNVMTVVERYNVNPAFLLAGVEPMFQEEEDEIEQEIREAKVKYVPLAARAGYCDQFNNALFADELKSYSIPGYDPKYGEHRCFDVSGDSMEPTIFGGDKLVCSLVSGDNYYSSVKDNHVYVVVTDDDILVKRVINRVRKKGEFLLMSDNCYYDGITVDVENVKEIWRVNLKIEHFMHDPSNVKNAIHEDIDRMRSTIKEQCNQMDSMNRALESLIKRNLQKI